MTLGNKFSQEEQAQATYENVATARRVILVNSAGNFPSASSGSFGTVTVGTTATLIKPANSSRIALIITPNTSGKIIFIGLDNSVTTANGIQLNQDDVFTIDQNNLYTGAIFGIVATGTIDIRFIEI